MKLLLMSSEVPYLGLNDRVYFTVRWCMFYNFTTRKLMKVVNGTSEKNNDALIDDIILPDSPPLDCD